MEVIKFEGQEYPLFQTKGFASKFAFPFAKEVCVGFGLDIGYGKPEWVFPGAIGIEQSKIFYGGLETSDRNISATSLPRPEYVMRSEERCWDYVFSSHVLEHLDDWVVILRHWLMMIKPGGTLFLYLPHYDQKYWRPWNNTKHKSVMHPQVIEDCLRHYGCSRVFVSGVDLNSSFMVMAEKGKP